jgi:hypothetical protein
MAQVLQSVALMKTILFAALGLMLCTPAMASKLGAQQKATVVAQLNKRVENGAWKVRLSGRVNAATRSFTANDIHTLPGPIPFNPTMPRMPGFEVGHMVKGTLNTKTNRISIKMNVMPK